MFLYKVNMGIKKRRIFIRPKFWVLFDTHLNILHAKTFWGHSSSKCEKAYIFKHFAKSKKLFCCQYLSYSV